MWIFSTVKVTILSLFLGLVSCGQQPKETAKTKQAVSKEEQMDIVVAANRTETYLPLLKAKRVAIVANQTSVIFKTANPASPAPQFTHLVDSLLSLEIDLKKVFAPEHGFRGKADAGEKVSDGMDIKTGLPIISLYGKNRKPTQEQLKDVDIVVFDIQDVGVRFYTYIATLQLVMEACAEAQIPIVVFDRPNPNGHYVDGPTMEAEYTSFLGMTEIPLVYGMTIGEYTQMINEEGWLQGESKVNLRIIRLKHYDHNRAYSLPIRPSPNLPNDTSITLYPSLGLFEGTHINAGRGTEYQFQRYGASFLDSSVYDFKYIPRPNFGSKFPKEAGKTCFGKDLANYSGMHEVSLQWLIDAYKNCTDQSKFFNTSGFTKHAGTETLQKQIEAGLSETAIKETWKEGLKKFLSIRKKYLLYPED